MDPSASEAKGARRSPRPPPGALGHDRFCQARWLGTPGTRGDRVNRPLAGIPSDVRGRHHQRLGLGGPRQGGRVLPRLLRITVALRRQQHPGRDRHAGHDRPMASNRSSSISTSLLPAELHRAFDVVFSHTVAEHVFDPPADVRDDGAALAGRRRKRRPVRAGRSLHSLVRRLRPADAAVLEAVLRGARLHPAAAAPRTISHSFPSTRSSSRRGTPSAIERRLRSAPLEFEPQLTGARWGRRVESGFNAPVD